VFIAKLRDYIGNKKGDRLICRLNEYTLLLYLSSPSKIKERLCLNVHIPVILVNFHADKGEIKYILIIVALMTTISFKLHTKQNINNEHPTL